MSYIWGDVEITILGSKSRTAGY